MIKLAENEKEFLLQTARKAISQYFSNRQTYKAEKLPSKKLSEKWACFVTLTFSGKTRGCVGSLEPQFPLADEVVKNALGAAFSDQRFPRLSRMELPRIKIDIAILETPKKVTGKSASDILKKISKPQGTMVKRGNFVSVFMPSRWTEFPEKEDFLNKLCLQGGFLADSWQKDSHLGIYTFDAIEFSE